jgi:hypothetical protein
LDRIYKINRRMREERRHGGGIVFNQRYVEKYNMSRAMILARLFRGSG